MCTYKYVRLCALWVLLFAVLVTGLKESRIVVAHDPPLLTGSSQVQFPFANTIVSGHEFNETWPCWTDTDGDGEVDTIYGYLIHTGGDWVGANGDKNVRAIADGVVTFVQYDAIGFGNHLEIAHKLPDGTEYHSHYAHLQPGTITVSPGETVTRNATVGTMGSSGTAFGEHLHFDIRIQDAEGQDVRPDDWPSPCKETEQQAHSTFDDWLAGGDIPRYVDPWSFIIYKNLAQSIVLFEDTYFRGQRYELEIQGDSSLSLAFSIPEIVDGRISSYAMPSNWYAVGYQSDDTINPSFSMSGADLDLRNNSFTNGDNANDKIAAVFLSDDQSVVQSCYAQQGGGVSCLPGSGAAPLPGSTPTPVSTPTPTPIPPGIRLCNGENYQGTCQSFPEGEYPDLDDYGVADWVESVKFDDSYTLNTDVWLYREDDFAGEMLHITEDAPDLGNLNNHVRSLKIDVREETTAFCSDLPDGITLFDEHTYNGDQSPTFTANYSNLSNIGWSDRASSLRSCGYCVRLWTDADYKGVSTEWCGNNNILVDDAVGENTVTSIQVWKRMPQAPGHIAPDAGETITGSSVTFHWYEIYSSPDNTYLHEYKKDGIVITSAWQSDNEITIDNLTPGTYHWRVRGKNPHGYGPWSSWRSLIVESGVPTPTPTPVPTNTPVPSPTPTPVPSGTWSTPESIPGTTGDTDFTRVLIDGDGAIHAVWREAVSSGHAVKYAVQSNGTWSSPVDLSNMAGSSRPGGFIIDDDGTLHLTLMNTTGSYQDIYYMIKPDGGSWTTPVNLTNSTRGNSYVADIAMDSIGTIHLVYWRTNYWQPFYMYKSAGGSWSNPLANPLAPQNWAFNTTIAIDSNDTLHVFWSQQNPLEYEVFYTAKQSGGSWSSPTTLSFCTSCQIPQVDIDSSDTIHVLAENATQDGTGIYYTKKPQSGSWSTGVYVGDSPSEPGENAASIAVDASNSIHALYRNNGDIFHTTTNGSGWSTTANVSVTAEHSQLPYITHGNGMLVAIWSEEVSGTDYPYVAVYE